MPTNRVAFLVPGIFGSGLTVQGQEIWGPNFFSNYSRVATVPAILAWTGSQASSILLQDAHIRLPWLPIPIFRQKLWFGVIEVLRKHPDFGLSSIFEVPYDWRDSLLSSSKTFATRV